MLRACCCAEEDHGLPSTQTIDPTSGDQAPPTHSEYSRPANIPPVLLDERINSAGGEALPFRVVRMAKQESSTDSATTTSPRTDEAEAEADTADSVLDISKAPQSFWVEIEKDSREVPLGANLDVSDGSILQVCSMRRGTSPVSEYNRKAPRERRIREGDYIVQVNEVSSSSQKMVSELLAKTSLRLHVRRASEFTVNLNRRQDSIGLDLCYANRGRSVVIKEVLPGLVSRWNQANPEASVRTNDRIIRVNDTGGSPAELLDLIDKSVMLDLTLARPSEPSELDE